MPGTPPGSPSGAAAAAAKAKTVADSGVEEAADDSLKLLALQEQQACDAHAAKERAAAAPLQTAPLRLLLSRPCDLFTTPCCSTRLPPF